MRLRRVACQSRMVRAKGLASQAASAARFFIQSQGLMSLDEARRGCAWERRGVAPGAKRAYRFGRIWTLGCARLHGRAGWRGMRLGAVKLRMRGGGSGSKTSGC